MPPNKKAAPAGAAFKNNLHHQFYPKPRRKQGNFTVVKKDFVRSNQAALSHLPRLLTALNVQFRQGRREITMLNPHRPDKNYGSFSINCFSGRWCDFAVSNASGIDAIALVAYLLNVKQGEAAGWIQKILGAGI